MRGNGYTFLYGGGVLFEFCYCEQEVGFQVFVPEVFTFCRASCNVKVNFCIVDFSSFEGFFDSCSYFRYIYAPDINGLEALVKSLQVFFESEDFSVIASYYLINAVSKIKSSVEMSGREVVEGYDIIINHGDFHGSAP